MLRLLIVGSLLVFTVGCATSIQQGVTQTEATALIKSEIEFAPGTEILATRLFLPAHATVSKHYHNGEEYLYIASGHAYLTIKGEKEVKLSAGTLTKIPYKKVHWARAGGDTVEAIIFRTHEKGKPVRVDMK